MIVHFFSDFLLESRITVSAYVFAPIFFRFLLYSLCPHRFHGRSPEKGAIPIPYTVIPFP